MTTPARFGLIRLLGRGSQADAPVEWHGLNLDVESLAVGVLPGAADTGPDRVSTFPVADMVGDVARWFRRRRLVVG